MPPCGMRNPRRLEVMARANELTDLVYLATESLPASEKQGLVDQLRRAVTSIGSNIAEGCGRSTDKAFLAYLQNAMSSADEVEHQTEQAIRLQMGDREALLDSLSMVRRVKSMIAKLSTAIRKRLGD